MSEVKTVTHIKIVDRNNFGVVLIQRAFTDRSLGLGWAEAQIDDIHIDLHKAGEDLFDIGIEEMTLTLDDDSMSKRTKWR